MTCRITILCDNSVGPLSATLGEHGFAALLEWEGGKLLFDTGGGETLLHNARRMKKDLASVGKVVLSHGHFDHTGGIKPLLEGYGPKEIFAHPGVFAPRFRVKDTGESLAIGIPYPEESLRNAGGAFNLSAEFREIGPAIFLTGEVPRRAPFERGDTRLSLDDAGSVPDTVPDDQSLVIRTEKGLVLLLGCCHAGLVNTIEHAREMSGVREIFAIIGGTHLGFCGEQQLEETMGFLRQCRIKKLSPGHCTGFAASARLFREFPGEVRPAAVGYTLEV